MGFTAVTGFVVYGVSYKLISKYKCEDMKEPTSSLFRLVGLLVSLMLSLAFSEVIVDHRLCIIDQNGSNFSGSLHVEQFQNLEGV